jgi:hypothetical protein
MPQRIDTGIDLVTADDVGAFLAAAVASAADASEP